MSENKATVACGKCGRALDEPTDLPLEQRQPCPVCGSTARTFSVVVTASVAVASALSATAKVEHVEKAPADERPEAATVRGRYRATLDWYKLENGFWLLHVLNEHGEVVEGGVGDDSETALLEVYERLIPPE